MGWVMTFAPQILKYTSRAVLWVPRRLGLVKQEKKEAEGQVVVLLESYKKLLKEQISIEKDDAVREALQEELGQVDAAMRGYYRNMLERILDRSGMHPYDAMVANGEVVLQPEDKAKLAEAVARLDILPPPYTAEEFAASASAKQALGRYDEALAEYNKALELRPDYARALINRGIIYRHLKQYDKALADYNRTLELIPDSPSTLYNRGITYRHLERYEEALADYASALQLKPGYPRPLYNSACVLSLMGKSDESLSYLQKAIDADEKYRQMAADDSDFDNIRDDPRFRRLIEGA